MHARVGDVGIGAQIDDGVDGQAAERVDDEGVEVAVNIPLLWISMIDD